MILRYIIKKKGCVHIMFMRVKKIESILNRLQSEMSERLFNITNIEYIECGYNNSNNTDIEGEWKVSDTPMLSNRDKHYMLKAKFKTPEKKDGYEIYLNFKNLLSTKPGYGFGCILYLNGKMIQEFDDNHTDALIEYDKEYEMVINYYGALAYDGMQQVQLYISQVNIVAKKAYYDIKVPFDCLSCIDADSNEYAKILESLDYAVNLIDFCDEKSDKYYESLEKASEYLNDNFYNGICTDKNEKIYCVGQTHIDVAWCWSLDQTREKVQRSFSTVLKLMEKYPEYKFMCSQPQLYEFLKNDSPEVYERIKQKVREGKWEVEGAMWLEADCNLLSGESFIRQLIHGKKFIKDEFGVDSKCLWQPDVFGYSASLPQILKKCGVDTFLTTKISWNEFNKMPYSTFLWEGLDGTRIFTHFFDYLNADLNPASVKGVSTASPTNQKMYSKSIMLGYGFGDGGGGVTDKMLENQRRLSYGIPGMPQTTTSTVNEFLDVIKEEFDTNCKNIRRTPLWVGELYLEFHRGTYTSVARIKKNNRKFEFLQQQTELLSSINSILLNEKYPKERLTKNLKVLLLNQFHDIIPGSSIAKVYEDSDAQFKEIFEDENDIFTQKLSSLSNNIDTLGGSFAFNSNGFSCPTIVDVNNKSYFVNEIPNMGYGKVELKETENRITFNNNIVDTPFYTVKFNDSMNIVSLYDKENNKECVQKGTEFNKLKIYEDIPYSYNAWDICEYAWDKTYDVDSVTDVKTEISGDRFELIISRKFSKSSIVQKLCFYNSIRRIDVKNSIDWNNHSMVLKAEFPVNVHTDEATYDTQFGNLKRPTHKNTSWDRAKFEVCAHKWGDVSEADYGVSILNDCKFGYSCDLNVMSLTLLKSPINPCKDVDTGHHEFTYSIYPHKGNCTEGKTVFEAYMLNNPVRIFELPEQSGTLKESFEFVKVDDSSVMTETVKSAEQGDEIVVRMYEQFNRRCVTDAEFGFDVKRVYICDMLENIIDEVEVKDNKISLEFTPFEIKTLKIEK